MTSPIKKHIKIGNCDLYHGDCLEIMPLLGRVDSCVTDPPYEFETSGAGIFRSNRKNMDEIAAAGLAKGFDLESITAEQFGAVSIFCHNDQLAEIIPYLADKFKRFAVLSWHKSNPMPVANKHYQPDTEFWVHAWNSGFAPVGDLKDKKRFYFGKGGQDTTINHPTVKPLPLMEKVVGNSFGVICDPYLGSGTTLVACAKLGRKGIGIELDPDYFEIACKRVQEAYDQPDLFVEKPKQKPAETGDMFGGDK